MPTKSVFLALACAAIVESLAPSAGSAQTPASYMTGAQIQKEVVGKTFSSVTKRGFNYTMQFNANGTGMADDSIYGRSVKDPLTWELKGDVFCFHSASGRSNECNKVRSAGNGKLDFVDSSTGILNNTYTPQ
jgi:hypothetical protein